MRARNEERPFWGFVLYVWVNGGDVYSDGDLGWKRVEEGECKFVLVRVNLSHACSRHPGGNAGGLEVKGEAQAAELGWMSSPRWGREGSRGPALRLSQRQVLGRSSGGQ